MHRMSSFDAILAVVADEIPKAEVDCLLIGGFAVNHYGYSRNTLDVDFVIVAEDLEKVRRVMLDAGFVNVSVHDNVVFFRAGANEPRVDFLRVNGTTMRTLLADAVPIEVLGHTLRVPSLRDLLAMKIFALAQNTARRMGKDLPDIAFLTVLNGLDMNADIRPLCDRFGTPQVHELIRTQVEALQQP
jgi:hypothetical protein